MDDNILPNDSENNGAASPSGDFSRSSQTEPELEEIDPFEDEFSASIVDDEQNTNQSSKLTDKSAAGRKPDIESNKDTNIGADSEGVTFEGEYVGKETSAGNSIILATPPPQTFDNDNQYSLLAGIPIERDINTERVLDALMERGVRFGSSDPLTGKSVTYLAMPSGSVDSLKLYSDKGKVLEMTDQHCIRIENGELKLTLKNPNHTYAKGNRFSATKSTALNEANSLADDNEIEAPKPGGNGGMSLFNSRSGGKKTKKTDLSWAMGGDALSASLINDMKAASTLMKDISGNGGASVKANSGKMQSLYETMDRINTGFQGMEKAGLNISKSPDFVEIKKMSDELLKTGAGLGKDFIMNGKSILDNDAMKAVKEGLANAVANLSALFGRTS